MNVEMVFDIGNAVCLVGTVLLIYAIFKNRNVLKGFQPIGSLLTFIAMSFFEFNYYQMCMWKSFLFSLPTVALWFVTSFYSIRNWFRNRKKKRDTGLDIHL